MTSSSLCKERSAEKHYGPLEEASLRIAKKGILGTNEESKTDQKVRKRHQNKHLDFDLVLLRTRRSMVRVPPGAPLLYRSDPDTWVTQRT